MLADAQLVLVQLLEATVAPSVWIFGLLVQQLFSPPITPFGPGSFHDSLHRVLPARFCRRKYVDTSQHNVVTELFYLRELLSFLPLSFADRLDVKDFEEFLAEVFGFLFPSLPEGLARAWRRSLMSGFFSC